jgi:hypothetical protein
VGRQGVHLRQDQSCTKHPMLALMGLAHRYSPAIVQTMHKSAASHTATSFPYSLRRPWCSFESWTAVSNERDKCVSNSAIMHTLSLLLAGRLHCFNAKFGTVPFPLQHQHDRGRPARPGSFVESSKSYPQPGRDRTGTMTAYLQDLHLFQLPKPGRSAPSCRPWTGICSMTRKMLSTSSSLVCCRVMLRYYY